MEHSILTVKSILADRVYDEYAKESILLLAVTAVGIKPLSSFGATPELVQAQMENAQRLGLHSKLMLPNDQGHAEIIVSKSPQLIDRYLQIDRQVHDQDQRTRRFGEIFGYPEAAIEEFILSNTEHRPMNIWGEIVDGASVSEEVALVWQIVGMLPPALRDPATREMGAKIKQLLLAIDPELYQEYVQLGLESIKQYAAKAITDW